MVEKEIACIYSKYTDGGKWVRLLDMYEGINGWYWYVTQRYADKDVVFGFVKGFEDEWGDIYLPEIQEQVAKGRVWKVPEKAWTNNSLVKMIPASQAVEMSDS